jgi:hypothetical protein
VDRQRKTLPREIARDRRAYAPRGAGNESIAKSLLHAPSPFLAVPVNGEVMFVNRNGQVLGGNAAASPALQGRSPSVSGGEPRI